MCLLAHRAMCVQRVVIGVAQQADSLPKEVQAAYHAGASTIVIRPGVYLLPNTGQPLFECIGWKNVTIDATGATLILTGVQWGEECFVFNRCRDVTLKGGVITQNAVTCYQGRIVSVEKDSRGNVSALWKPDSGYPSLPAGTSRFPGAINVVDQNTHKLKAGDGDYYNPQVSPAAAGEWKINFNTPHILLTPGDWLVGRYGNAPIKLHLINCHNCVMKNVTLERNGFAPIREEGGGGNHYLHCTWKTGPPPPGAKQPLLVTNSADGMHMTGSNPGPDIEACQFHGVFLDDCIAIHGYFTNIKSVDGDTFTTDKPAGNNAAAGQKIRISAADGFYADVLVTAVKQNANGTTTVTLAQSLPVPAGAKFSNPACNGEGYKIIGCHIGDTRSRGILAKSDRGLIEDNSIQHCGMSAVSLGPEYYWGEADYVHRVMVRNNYIAYNGGASYGGPALWVHGHGAAGNSYVTIENNRFRSNYQGDIVLEWGKHFVVEGNLLEAAKTWPQTTTKVNPIRLNECEQVTLLRNVFRASSFWNLPFASVQKNVEGLLDYDTQR